MGTLINQPSATPTRKVTAFTIGGTISGLAMIALAAFAPEAYERIQLYPGAEGHLATAIGLLLAYFTRDKL